MQCTLAAAFRHMICARNLFLTLIGIFTSDRKQFLCCKIIIKIEYVPHFEARQKKWIEKVSCSFAFLTCSFAFQVVYPMVTPSEWIVIVVCKNNFLNNDKGFCFWRLCFCLEVSDTIYFQPSSIQNDVIIVNRQIYQNPLKIIHRQSTTST